MSEQKYTALAKRVEYLIGLTEKALGDTITRPKIDSKARYRLSEAAEYLAVSESTIRRRAIVGKIVTRYDGRTPFISGAEILRYAREGSRRRPRRRSRSTSTNDSGGA